MGSIFYIFLAILGLNLLVFIHELGHYIVARREGMKVEVFSIGFGKPMVSWMMKGVKWQICPIFVGGYVKIAGMEKEGELEPHEIPEGFYSKKPWARIKVALAGPIVNLVFAVFVFGIIWVMGGREKPFSQYTRLIGWIDPQSEIFEKGVRPGDEITDYNGETFSGFQDLIYASIMNGRPANVEGNKIDYFSETKVPYDYTVKPYESPQLRKGFTTIGVLAPAGYLIYDEFNDPLFANAPILKSGIQKNDRLMWVDGELIFSQDQLAHSLNNNKTLLTVQRGNEVFLVKAPRIPVSDLRIRSDELSELEDWKYEAGLSKHDEAIFMPYLVDSNLTVEKSVYFVDDKSRVTHVTEQKASSPIDFILNPGDQILAVDGIPVHSGSELLQQMQTRKIQIIVKRDADHSKISWKTQDRVFEMGTDWDAIIPIAGSIGTEQPLRENGNFILLEPVTPIQFKDFPFPEEQKAALQKRQEKQRQEIEKINNPEEREQALAQLEQYQSRYILGAPLQDRSVVYNPQPFILFGTIFQEITRNLVAFASGHVSPKHFGGPLFIMQVMKQSWAVGIKEALFWLGAISLNLGVLNLLPIPVLDGGHICFSIIERIRGKRMKAKTMQRLIIPFVALLIFFGIFLTYNDLTRIFGRFF